MEDGNKTGNKRAFRHLPEDSVENLEERRQMEEGPEDREESLLALINATQESLMLIDREGTVLRVNEIGARRLGMNPEDLTGACLYDHLPEDVWRVRKGQFDTVIATGTLVRFVDHRAGRFYETYAYPVSNREGRATRLAIFACDVTDRIISDRMVKESERKYREFVDLLPQTVSEFGLDGTYTFVNLKGYEAFGYSKDDLNKGVTIFDTLAPEDHEKARTNMARRLRGEVFGSTEYTMMRKNGTTFPALIHTSPVMRETKAVGMRTVVVDITEQRRAEEALKESEERYRSIFENAVLGIFQSSPDGRLIRVNAAFAAMHGYASPEEMIAATTDIAEQHYVEPEERTRFQRLLQEQGIVKFFEAQFFRADGSKVWLLMNARAVAGPDGNMLYYEGTSEEITDRREGESALRESEERYRTVIENSNDGIAILSGENHVYVNGKFVAIFGYDGPGDFIGKPISIACHPDDLERVMENNMRRQRGEDLPSRYEFKGIRKDGVSIYVEVSVARTTHSGRPVSLVFLRDVTERKNLESQVRQAHKMEAIGQLAGGIAHDFNNILTALIGFGSLLQMKMEESHPLRFYVNQILATSQKAANLTQSLLAFSRKQAIELRPHNVNTIIANIENLLRRLLSEDIDLNINLTANPVTIMADITQVEQVVLNLVTNARDAMPKGGKLLIETSPVVLDQEFRRAYQFGKPGSYVLISVRDTGSGMDEKTIEKIFEPFFTTKDVGRGTGLGLSIVYGIVKQHNGYITVSSEPGSGTTFLVYLPLTRTGTTEAGIVHADTRGGKETVLVAEDNEEARHLVKEILSQSGYTVIEAVDGEDAIQAFTRHKETVSLLLLDVVMPKKNGKEVYEAIEKMRPGIKTIFMSGYTGDVVLEKGIQDKTVEFVAKPTPIGELLLKVRHVLDSR